MYLKWFKMLLFLKKNCILINKMEWESTLDKKEGKDEKSEPEIHVKLEENEESSHHETHETKTSIDDVCKQQDPVHFPTAFQPPLENVFVFQVNHLQTIPKSAIRGLETLICVGMAEPNDPMLLSCDKSQRPSGFHAVLSLMHMAYQNRRPLSIHVRVFQLLIQQGIDSLQWIQKNQSAKPTTSMVDTANPGASTEKTPTATHVMEKEKKKKKENAHSIKPCFYEPKRWIRPVREAQVHYPPEMLDGKRQYAEKARARPGWTSIALIGSIEEWTETMEWLALWSTVFPDWIGKLVSPLMKYLFQVRCFKQSNSRWFWNRMYFTQPHSTQVCIHGWITAFFPIYYPCQHLLQPTVIAFQPTAHDMHVVDFKSIFISSSFSTASATTTRDEFTVLQQMILQLPGRFTLSFPSGVTVLKKSSTNSNPSGLTGFMISENTFHWLRAHDAKDFLSL